MVSYNRGNVVSYCCTRGAGPLKLNLQWMGNGRQQAMRTYRCRLSVVQLQILLISASVGKLTSVNSV